MKLNVETTITNGKVTRNLNLLRDAFASFEGKDIVITLDKVKKKRSNPQNSYYWSTIIPIMRNALKEAGHTLTNENTHELLKLRFLKETVLINEDTGEFIERIKSTTELSTSGMMDYFAEITVFAAEYFGVQIPEPNDIIRLEL